MMSVVAALAAVALVVSFSLAMGARPVPWTALVYMAFVPAPFLVAGIYLLRRRPESRTTWLLVGATAGAMCFPLLLEVLVTRRHEVNGVEAWMAPLLAGEALMSMAGLACLVLLIGLFPRGVPRTARQRRLATVTWLLPLPMLVALLSARHIPVETMSYEGIGPFENPFAVRWLGWLDPLTSQARSIASLAVVAAIIAVVVRYRGEEPAVRRQLRWMLFGSSSALVFAVLPWVALPLLGPGALAHGTVLVTLSSAALILIPATVVIALTQPAWIDTDAVIPRGFAYGVLSVLVVVLYLGIAAGLGLAAAGALLQVEVAVLVTVVVALVFNPARVRLQRTAERWVFGARPTPMGAIAGFDRTTQGTSSADLAPILADLVRKAARLRWAEVSLSPVAAATAGTPRGEATFTVPIAREGEAFGTIRCGPKVAGVLNEDDRELVCALAAQSGLLMANARLAGRIVHAHEAERRRIERNIHDGTQQELVALVAKLALARVRLRDGHLDDAPLAELQDDARGILRDLRDLAQGIHPTVLTDGGLVEAVEDRCRRLPIDVTLETSPGLRRRRFDDDVEGAAFFFVTEGLANTLKHASASGVRVGLHAVGDYLELSISDDGTGFRSDSVQPRGLAGLSDRIAALAGTLRIEPAPGSGTVLSARLPVHTAAT
ncbi:GAF domain-containing sensor histidine kinase [Isoptericola croceus]|uniref:GAF domain-containing sensor histidine kinase n=1 Tax=Isoptericola croceus TaxID=3031406 RepID=UPI0023F8AAA9|nr:histidine kinase [Isoptericola croceus]